MILKRTNALKEADEDNIWIGDPNTKDFNKSNGSDAK